MKSINLIVLIVLLQSGNIKDKKLILCLKKKLGNKKIMYILFLHKTFLR